MRRADSLDAVAEKTTAGLEMLLRAACWQLKLKGHPEACAEIERGWYGGMRARYRWATIDTEGLGDHQPLSLWLAVVYGILEQYLGHTLMTMMHLDDINIFNFAVPVVRDPHEGAAWCQELPLTPCKDEYITDHFVPLSGVAAYWIGWGACMGATWGTGWGLICTPVGQLSEKIVVARVGPKLGLKIWTRNNPVFDGIGGDTPAAPEVYPDF